MSKDIGIVTAYGYARSKGYTGTEEEFAELMAHYAQSAQAAVLSAASAADSMNAAARSADTAAAAAASVSAVLPDGGSVSEDGLLSIRHGTEELFSVQLPLYGGESA